MNYFQIFCDLTGIFPKGLPSMLTFLKLKHTGRLHSGIGGCFLVIFVNFLHYIYVFMMLQVPDIIYHWLLNYVVRTLIVYLRAFLTAIKENV